jgi:anti-sigma28 factor (negative regulator of flagellin synthesis)
MEIGNKSGAGPGGVLDGIDAAVHRGRKVRGLARKRSHEIDVPDVARALARFLGRIDEAAPDPARAAQLAILRNAVAAGRYAPDPRDVARKLLAEVAAERAR